MKLFVSVFWGEEGQKTLPEVRVRVRVLWSKKKKSFRGLYGS